MRGAHRPATGLRPCPGCRRPPSLLRFPIPWIRSFHRRVSRTGRGIEPEGVTASHPLRVWGAPATGLTCRATGEAGPGGPSGLTGGDGVSDGRPVSSGTQIQVAKRRALAGEVPVVGDHVLGLVDVGFSHDSAVVAGPVVEGSGADSHR